MRARARVGDSDVVIDLERPVSLAIEIAFNASGPHHFGAPPAHMHPMRVAGFSGSVAEGASCNCSTLTLTPHANGTHTECVGHLTLERLDALAVVPAGLIPAVLVTVTPENAARSGETSDPVPRRDDRLVTRRRLEEAWPQVAWPARALAIRTLPNPLEKLSHDYTGESAPYLSREAAEWLLERGIEHLVVDLPSIDRIEDEGLLTAHRLFFGLPPGSHSLASARRAHCTVTELAYIPDSRADGIGLLEIQVPALAGDAVPSRPLLYAPDAIA